MRPMKYMKLFWNAIMFTSSVFENRVRQGILNLSMKQAVLVSVARSNLATFEPVLDINTGRCGSRFGPVQAGMHRVVAMQEA
jgi:hypothetical protein